MTNKNLTGCFFFIIFILPIQNFKFTFSLLTKNNLLVQKVYFHYFLFSMYYYKLFQNQRKMTFWTNILLSITVCKIENYNKQKLNWLFLFIIFIFYKILNLHFQFIQKIISSQSIFLFVLFFRSYDKKF